MNLYETVESIFPANEEKMVAAKARWDSIAKPLGSLGKLEDCTVRLAGILNTENPRIDKRAVCIFCADNGVVAQGVTQSDSSITAIVTENFIKGDTSVCAMARGANAEIVAIDIGINRPMDMEGLWKKKVALGTKDFTKDPAMTREEAIQSLEVGIEMAFIMKEKGFQILATGEMGIGNTTTSSALAAVFLNLPVEEVTGRGAGLSSQGLLRKIAAIEKGIGLHKPDAADPIGVLAALGGFDIGGMAGLFLGGAACGLPVIIDGFISSVAALLAARICPQVVDYMLPSHVSKELAGRRLLEELHMQPLLDCDMCLGEGTGAVALLPLLDLGLRVYEEMATFQETKIEQYQKLV